MNPVPTSRFSLHFHRREPLLVLGVLLTAFAVALPAQTDRALVIADALFDQAGTGALRASSQPRPGDLLPLGPYWFVGPAGNVGFGTTSPSGRFEVSSRTETMARFTTQGQYGTAAGVQILTPDIGWTIGAGSSEFGGSRALGFRTFDARTVMVIHDGGSVGMGTLTPAAKLHVASSGVTNLMIQSTGSYGEAAVLGLRRPEGNWDIATGAEDYGGPGGLGFRDTGRGVTHLVIRSNGNVGLGTTNPGERLDVNGSIRASTVVITGGADLAETFGSTDPGIEPGTVMVLDPESPGSLRVGTKVYDPLVAGVVPGAGGLRPGLLLSPINVTAGRVDLALNGQVFVKCTAANGAIRPGDLLTTAARSGHAMRVTDHERSRGAVIGKAMSSLADGEGLVRVLVNLQ